MALGMLPVKAVGALTGVSLAVTPPAPQPLGTQITLTATPQGGTTVEYLFGVWYLSGGTQRWVTLRNYAANPVFVDKPPITGALTFEVRAREVGATAYVSRQASFVIGTTPPPPPPPPTGLTAVSLSITPASPRPRGTTLTLTATPTGGTTVEYQFRVGYISNGVFTWRALRNYATNPVFIETPPIAADFTFEVRAREAGTTAEVSDQESFQYGVVTPPPPPPPPTGLTAVSLVITPPAPQPRGTTLTLTATPDGGTNVEYQFRVGFISNGVFTWRALRNYGTNPVLVDTPPIAADFTFEVHAREQGTTVEVSDQESYQYGVVTPPPPAAGRIAFISKRDGNEEVYIMNPDGSGQTRLTVNTAVEMEEAWRPDGGRIIFTSKRDGTYEIYTMNPDGSGQTRLTNDTLPDWGPSYAPDGAKILFFRTVTTTDEIYVMNADGTNQVRLTTNDWFDVLPVMTPDGTKVVFDTDRNGSVRQANYDIYIMNPDGSGQVQLTNGPGREWYHAISPNGQFIAYICDDHINVMNLDGGNQHAITFPSGYQDSRPTFSPDGSKIAFASNRDGNWQIYVMNADGTGQTRITQNMWDDYYPAWSLK